MPRCDGITQSSAARLRQWKTTRTDRGHHRRARKTATRRVTEKSFMRRLVRRHIDPAVRAPLFDQGLRAEDDGEGEALRVPGAGFGRVDHDADVVDGDEQDVAVEGDSGERRMVD